MGQPVLGQVGPVVHEGQEDPVPQVQGEPASGANLALAVWSGEPFGFCLRVCFFDIAYQKIKLLERYADGCPERAGVL